MISTAEVGTFYKLASGMYAMKLSQRNQGLGKVHVVVTSGLHFDVDTENLTPVVITHQQVLAVFKQHLNDYQRPRVTLVPPPVVDFFKQDTLKETLETTKSKGDPRKSDGSSASYYQLPENCKELQDLISHRNMNAQMGEIFRATYRFGMASHSDQLRDAKKIKFYIDAEIKRLESQ